MLVFHPEVWNDHCMFITKILPQITYKIQETVNQWLIYFFRNTQVTTGAQK